MGTASRSPAQRTCSVTANARLMPKVNINSTRRFVFAVWKNNLRAWLPAFAVGVAVGWGLSFWQRESFDDDMLVVATPSAAVAPLPIKYPPLESNVQPCPAEAEMSELLAAASPRSEVVNRLARRWTAASPAGALNVAQVLALADSLLARWKYRDDPQGNDELAPAARTLRSGMEGDCEDFAAAGAALAQAIGARTRVVKAWSGDAGHAWFEVSLGVQDAAKLDMAISVSRSNLLVYEDKASSWLRVDWSCRSGACFEAERGLIFDLQEKSCAVWNRTVDR